MSMTIDPKRPEPKCALLVMCVECGAGAEVLLPTDRDAIARVLAGKGWFTSVLSPPEQGPDATMLIGALCSTCAPTVLRPEVLRVAEERRQQLLRGPR